MFELKNEKKQGQFVIQKTTQGVNSALQAKVGFEASLGTIVEPNLSLNSPIKFLFQSTLGSVLARGSNANQRKGRVDQIRSKKQYVLYFTHRKGPRLHNKNDFLSCMQALFLWVKSELYFLIPPVWSQLGASNFLSFAGFIMNCTCFLGLVA